MEITVRFPFFQFSKNCLVSTISKRDQTLLSIHNSFAYQIPDLYGVYIAFDDDTFSGIYRDSSSPFGITIGAQDVQTGFIYQDLQLNSKGDSRNLSAVVRELDDYKSTTSDFFIDAKAKGSICFGSVYPLLGESDFALGVTISIPLYMNASNSSTFVGVAGVDLKLDSFSDSLGQIQIDSISSKIVFVMESSGILAISTDDVIYQLIGGEAATMEANASSSSTVADTATFLLNKYESISSIPDSFQQVKRPYDDAVTFTYTLTDAQSGLNWITVFTFPYDEVYKSISYISDLSLLLLIIFLMVNFICWTFSELG